MQSYKRITHTFEPVYNENSKLLILGSLPSVKSREDGFYYGHPMNRFWRVISILYGKSFPVTKEEKRELLLSLGIAVWDVIESCDIKGSSDSSIQNVVPIDLTPLLASCEIQAIYANGKTAARLYRRYTQPVTQREIIELPSTSPANAAYSLERLVECWKERLGKKDG